eukprot:m.148479 g.148479  ORF g.148479 m.148479 type:complete len:207 (-) comp9718_c0_seq7:89-709(-)
MAIVGTIAPHDFAPEVAREAALSPARRTRLEALDAAGHQLASIAEPNRKRARLGRKLNLFREIHRDEHEKDDAVPAAVPPTAAEVAAEIVGSAETEEGPANDLFKGIVNEIDRRMENRMRKVAHNERARRFNSRASGTSPFRALFIEGSSDADVSPPHFPLNRIKLFEISSDHLKSLEDAFKLTGIPQTAAQLLKRQERFLNFITE